MSTRKKRFFKKTTFALRTAGRASAAKANREAQRKEMVKLARQQALAVFASQVEEKYIDTSAAATSVDYIGSVGLFGMPGAGTTSITRVGDLVTVKRLDFKFNLIVADTTNIVRVILFKWNNDDAQYAPTVNSIITSTDASTGYAALARYNWDNFKGRDFEVLYDKAFQLCANGEQGQVHQVSLWGKGLGSTPKIQLNTGATTGKGRYGILYISDSAAVSHPTLAYTCRITFSDA